MHNAHAAAPQRATDAPARLGGRIRPRSRRLHVQNMLVRCGSTKHLPRQAHSDRLCRTCTHAPTLRGHASRGHGRTACTQEGHRWPMGACPRPGRHDAHVLAADVAVAETGVPALLERVARCVADLDRYVAACVERVPVKEPSRGVAAPPCARYTRPPSPKHPYPVKNTPKHQLLTQNGFLGPGCLIWQLTRSQEIHNIYYLTHI